MPSLFKDSAPIETPFSRYSVEYGIRSEGSAYVTYGDPHIKGTSDQANTETGDVHVNIIGGIHMDTEKKQAPFLVGSSICDPPVHLERP